jgi:plastocyanin
VRMRSTWAGAVVALLAGRPARQIAPAALTLALALLLAGALSISAQASPPHSPLPPETGGTGVDLDPRPCALEGNDRFEKQFYKHEGWKGPDYERYPGDCERLRFSHGPLAIKPGQNDVLVEPVKIDKPMRDGYITRIEPNLVRPDGTVPPTEEVHLHHGTWLSVPSYGSGPFFAAGEEKTIAPFPRGYGMPVKATDVWLLLYMVHSAVQEPMTLYITYDVDFIPEDKAEELGIKPAYPVWLDVRPAGYPVFNTQRDYGGKDGTCTWPKEECAAHDPWGEEFVGQGKRGNGKGEDLKLPAEGGTLGAIENFTGGTLIGIGGHVHPGGLQNEIDLVRNGKKRRIYTGRAAYWKRNGKPRAGGPPTSWDFSMRVTGLPYWGVHVKPGDKLRSNATYDTTHQSTYENMGIAVTLLVPDGENGKPQAPGVDPFRAPRDRSKRCKSGGLTGKRKTLCDQGLRPTHGPLPENDNYGGADGKWTAETGDPTNGVTIADFLYLPGDLSMIEMTGVPTVNLGNTLDFVNVDGAAIYHTVTSCDFPCLGRTGTAFPLSDGETSKGRPVDFDSSELGIGPPEIGPAKGTLEWGLPVTKDEGFKPGEVVTYFCRIHPSMRGAFEVTE